jgi:SnoaL-like domain
MKTTDELRQGELARRAEEFRIASQDRDVERMLALFADDAEVTMAPGTFRGKAVIRKFFEWEVRMALVATSCDAGLGMVVVGRSVVWECQISPSWRRSPRGCPAPLAGSPGHSSVTSSPRAGRAWRPLQLDLPPARSLDRSAADRGPSGCLVTVGNGQRLWLSSQRHSSSEAVCRTSSGTRHVAQCHALRSLQATF